MKRFVLGAIGIAVVLAAAAMALIGPFDNPVTHAAADVGVRSEVRDLVRFLRPLRHGLLGFRARRERCLEPHLGLITAITTWRVRDRTTARDVIMSGPASGFDFSQLFWHCAPGGDGAKGHIMTAVDTTGYNIAWFAPKPLFSNVSQVCWDINETLMSRRKWTQVVFVSASDAVRYPAGGPTSDGGVAGGTGGFDLGYTNPDFRQDRRTTVSSRRHTIAGFRDLDGSANWFQNAQWMTEFVGPTAPDREQTTDKAARFKHCLTNMPNNTVRFTKDTPSTGTVTRDLPGQIPQGAVRVVFQDDNYDPIKDDRYSADALDLALGQHPGLHR